MDCLSWHRPALMDITIEPLHLHPQLRPAVAQLIYDEFWTNDPNSSPAWMEGRLSEAVDHARVPLSLVAMADGVMVGTINLIDNDDDKRPHLWPWLAALVSKGRQTAPHRNRPFVHSSVDE